MAFQISALKLWIQPADLTLHWWKWPQKKIFIQQTFLFYSLAGMWKFQNSQLLLGFQKCYISRDNLKKNKAIKNRNICTWSCKESVCSQVIIMWYYRDHYKGLVFLQHNSTITLVFGLHIYWIIFPKEPQWNNTYGTTLPTYTE